MNLASVVRFADSENAAFQNIHVVTCRSKFLEILGSPTTNKDLRAAMASNPSAVVHEYVDLRGDVPEICINVDRIDEDATMVALRKFADALDNDEFKASKYVVSSPHIQFTEDDLSVLVNRH